MLWHSKINRPCIVAQLCVLVREARLAAIQRGKAHMRTQSSAVVQLGLMQKTTLNSVVVQQGQQGTDGTQLGVIEWSSLSWYRAGASSHAH